MEGGREVLFYGLMGLVVSGHLLWWGMVRPPKLERAEEAGEPPRIRYQPQVHSDVVARYWSPIFVEGGFGSARGGDANRVLPPLGVELDLSMPLERFTWAEVAAVEPGVPDLAVLAREVVERFRVRAWVDSGEAVSPPERLVWSVVEGAERGEVVSFDPVVAKDAGLASWQAALDLVFEDGLVEQALIVAGSGDQWIDRALLRAAYRARLSSRVGRMVRVLVVSRGVDEERSP